MATTSRSARYAKWLSIPLGLVISALLIWQASYAAFTDKAVNADNTWTAGTVKISHNRPTPMFSDLPDLAPGADAKEQVVTATYEGSLDADVSFYALVSDDAPADHRSLELASQIDLVITATAGSTFESGPVGVIYTGTLAGFLATHDEFEVGLPYTATGGARQQGTFKFETSLRANAPDSVSGETIQVDFIAEAKSKP